MSTLTPEPCDHLRQEPPGWLREDLECRQWILNIARGEINGGWLIAHEIKSSMDKARLYIFSSKVDFHERKHQRKADYRLIITLFLEPRTPGLPEKLSIEVYADPTRIPVD